MNAGMVDNKIVTTFISDGGETLVSPFCLSGHAAGARASRRWL